jgi:hypothetical protein
LKCETSSGLTEEKFCDELLEDEEVECHRRAGDVVVEAAIARFAGDGRANDRLLDRVRLRKRAPAGRDGADMVGSSEGRQR